MATKPCGKEKTRHVVKNLTLTEVSLVDVPANPHSEVVLFKRGDLEMPEFSDMDRSVLEKKLTSANDIITRLTSELNIEKEVGAANVVALTKKLSDVTAELDQLRPKPVLELPAEFRKQLDDLAKSNAVLHEQLNKANDERLMLAFVGRVQDLDIVPTTPEKLAEICKRVSQGSSDNTDSDELIRLFRAMGDIVKKSATSPITKAVGHAVTVQDTDVDVAIKAKTAEILKAHPDMTAVQASARMWRENPELYDAYLRHQQQSIAAVQAH